MNKTAIKEKTFIMLPFTPLLEQHILRNEVQPALMIGLPYEHLMNTVAARPLPGQTGWFKPADCSEREGRLYDAEENFARFPLVVRDWLVPGVLDSRGRQRGFVRLDQLEVSVRKR